MPFSTKQCSLAVDDYLAKPLKREDLLALVDKYAEIAQNRQCVPADK